MVAAWQRSIGLQIKVVSQVADTKKKIKTGNPLFSAKISVKGLQPCVVVFWNAKKWMTSKILAAKFSVFLLFTVMSCEKEVQRLHAY